jgi:CelD/BcsL family acetyltransferase involved in cellulose biosynthesis
MRKALRHRTHHLERAGSIEFELYTGGPASRQAIAEAIDLKRTWMIQNGVVSTAFVDPATRECLLALAEDPNAGAVTMKLTVGGVPAAIRFGFEYKGCYFAYLAAYEAGMSHFSPGKMLMDFYVKRFRERAISKIDMLPPSVRHKTDWCHQQTRVADYTLPLTHPGLVYAWLYQERMRPGLRRIWNHLPAGIRSVAAALFVSI